MNYLATIECEQYFTTLNGIEVRSVMRVMHAVCVCVCVWQYINNMVLYSLY